MGNRIAIITGHSRGLGAALAELLRTQGWEVLGISRTAGASIDLASPAALTAWIANQLASQLSEASEIVLLNNAATVAPIALVGQQDPAEMITAVSLNVTAPLLLTDAVLRLRPAGVPVRVAHISSGAARRGYPGWSLYCATKAALDLHAQALAAEQQPGVRVAAIAPGVVDTQMQAEIRGAAFPGQERFVQLFTEGQLTSPADAAAAVWAIVSAPDFGQQPVTNVRG